MQEKHDKSLNAEQIYVHVAGLIIDGIETSSIVIQYALYEIAINSDVQERLKTEIDTILEKFDGQLTYEALHEMTYLDRVFKGISFLDLF